MKRLLVFALLLAAPLRAQTVPATSATSCTPAMTSQSYTDSAGQTVSPITGVKVGQTCSYSLNLAAGTYTVAIFAASTNPTGAAMHLEFPAGTNVSGPIVIPNTDCCVGSTPTHFVSVIGPNSFSLPANAGPVVLVVDPVGTETAGSGAHVNIASLTFATVTPPPPPPPVNVFSVNLSSVSFPATSNGTMAVPISVTMTNTSSAPLTISLVNTQQLAGQGSKADFGVFPAVGILGPLPPGASTTFLILFLPRTTGTITGNLLIQAGGQTTNVPLSGISQ